MAYVEQVLQLKKATFYSDKIVLHKKKGDVEILMKEIDRLDYTKPSLYNYLFAAFCGMVPSPGLLTITLRKPHNTAKKSVYIIRLKYDDYCGLPGDYLMKMNCN